MSARPASHWLAKGHNLGAALILSRISAGDALRWEGEDCVVQRITSAGQVFVSLPDGVTGTVAPQLLRRRT